MNITNENFETTIKQNEIVFIDFWAEWCSPCKTFAEIYETVANEYKTIVFAKTNVEKESALAETFQIRSIPHLMVFKQGILIYSASGTVPASILKELADQALSVDVAEIVKRISDS